MTKGNGAASLYFTPGGGSRSVLYSGASAFDLAMKAACASASSGGGASVRVATGWPRKPRPREQRSDAARNHEALVRAATAAVHREGPHVSMATIAADAGVGVGTLYRHFRTREDLLDFLAHRSFEQVLSNVQAAESDGTTTWTGNAA